MPTLNVNTDALVRYANKLEKLSRSAFPVVVRKTLNSAAFDVKKNTMPMAVRVFEKRDPNFFKANSKVLPAKGLNPKSMEAKVGFTSAKLKGGSNFAVKDLEQQEKGGLIKGKAFIPMDGARKGGLSSKVKPSHRMSKIKNVVNSRRFSGNKKQRLIKAIHAAKKGGYVIGGATLGENTLFKVTGLTKKGKFNLQALYDYQKGRSVKVKATNFMKIASTASSRKMDMFFIKAAKKQFEKALR